MTAALAAAWPSLAVGPVLAVGTEQEATVGPGLAGFLVMFALAMATVVLVRSMVGRLRKVRYPPVEDRPGAPGPGDDRSTPAEGDRGGSDPAGTDPPGH